MRRAGGLVVHHQARWTRAFGVAVLSLSGQQGRCLFATVAIVFFVSVCSFVCAFFRHQDYTPLGVGRGAADRLGGCQGWGSEASGAPPFDRLVRASAQVHFFS